MCGYIAFVNSLPHIIHAYIIYIMIYAPMYSSLILRTEVIARPPLLFFINRSPS